jgi:hypothetical protein
VCLVRYARERGGRERRVPRRENGFLERDMDGEVSFTNPWGRAPRGQGRDPLEKVFHYPFSFRSKNDIHVCHIVSK